MDFILSMNASERTFWYVMVGLTYWAINIFIRKLHKKNEPDDGWWLTPLWFLCWPVCFLTLIVMNIVDLRNKYKRHMAVYSQRLWRRIF